MTRISSNLLLGIAFFALCIQLANAESTYSFESYNFSDSYIRHKNNLGEISFIISDLDKKDSTFRVVRGLGGKCSSFESVNYPGFYLRHQNFRIKLHELDESDLFNKDATFCFTDGLASSELYSFESLNYPGHYIRHRDYQLYIEKDVGGSFVKDATFRRGHREWSVHVDTQLGEVQCPAGYGETTGFTGADFIFTGCKEIASDVGKQCKVNSECQYGCAVDSNDIKKAGCSKESAAYGGSCPGITGRCTKLPNAGNLVQEGEIYIRFEE